MKSTEYKATDDSDIKDNEEREEEDADESDEIDGINFATLKYIFFLHMVYTKILLLTIIN